jgi:hypothetical protein
MTAPFPRLTAPKPFDAIRSFLRRMREMVTPKVVELKVHLAYDDEADVWYVAASDIPGLSLEADNPQHLIDRIEKCAIELICLNMAEIQQKHAPREKPAVAVRPIFDSPLQLACAPA